MKNIFIILLLALFATNCTHQTNNNQNGDQKTVTVSPENLQVIEISVYGMSCEGCERTIQGTVGKLPGIQEVKASHLDSTVLVKFDKTLTNYEDMKTAITEKGYDVMDYKTVTNN